MPLDSTLKKGTETSTINSNRSTVNLRHAFGPEFVIESARTDRITKFNALIKLA